MKLLKIAEFTQMKNPASGLYKLEILTSLDNTGCFGGHFAILPPGAQAQCHYHEVRESIIVPISGETMQTVGEEEFLFKAGDVLFIPAGEKHYSVNKSDKEFRFLEFYTPPGADMIKI